MVGIDGSTSASCHGHILAHGHVPHGYIGVMLPFVLAFNASGNAQAVVESIWVPASQVLTSLLLAWGCHVR